MIYDMQTLRKYDVQCCFVGDLAWGDLDIVVTNAQIHVRCVRPGYRFLLVLFSVIVGG